MRLEMDADSVTWADWAYQNNYDGEVTLVESLPRGSFERSAYERTLRSLLRRLGAT